MEYVIEADHLEKKYKKCIALNDFSIHIEKGSIYGLIGKNGAGKTTFMRVICGLQKPTNGTYSIYGIKNGDKNISEVLKRLGTIIEKQSIYLNMSAKDNLIEQFKMVGNKSFDSINDVLKLVGLDNTGTKKAKYFSLGMKQRLGIAIAISNNPDLLILDEPINGLDPQGIIEIRNLVLQLNKERNITVLISSHYLDELSKIATNYGFVDNGKIILEINSSELKKKLKKKIELKVKDIESFAVYLKNNNIDYGIIDNQTLNIYGEINLQKCLSDMYINKLFIEDIHLYDESLENFYMDLIGGAKND